MKGWKTRSHFVAAPIFFLTAAFVFAKTGRDALFVQGRGLFDLPKAYVGIALLSGPLAYTVLSLFKSYGPRAVRILLPLATALSLIAFSTVVRPGGGVLMTLFFMFVPLFWGVIFSVSWLLASDLLDGASRDDTASGFSLVGGAAILGGVAAAALARLAAPHVEPRAFLWFAVFGLAMASAVMAEAQRRYPPQMKPRDAPSDQGGNSGAPSPLASSYTWALVAVGSAAAVVGVLIEFRFYLAASVSEGAGRDKAAFFANYYLALNLVALVVQIWVLPRLLHRIGVGGALLVLPLALVGGVAGLAASASLVVASAVRVTEGGLKSSIHRASWEQAYLAIRRADRAATKVFVDGVALRLAEGLAALALLLWLHYIVADSDVKGVSTLWITALLSLGALAWLASTRKLARKIRARESSLDAEESLKAPLPGG